ncbi:hypothetical protein CE91St19_31890 [Odoribacter laneus]|jgi:capsular polysaccharide synthesis enzyme|uniref:hypothetical protein n=2 Tax=Odoribacter laneus TaxID=626933 RepID=UPI00208B3973|nr:hypothetical protein CE91St19_31890 [Odoribacter laneus]GKI27059.1 hypothetical protein CE91St20_31960 [Odoribacter laneus]
MSMISLYTEWLLRDNIDFDIIYMDKYGENEDFPAKNKYVFKNIINPNNPRWYKALQYWKFKKFAVNILNNNYYDFIIVWNDVAIFMFANYLASRWKGKYCLNIRDYCYQKNIFIFRRFQKVINSSAFTTISSLGYKIFLPPYNYLQVHSLNLPVLKQIIPRSSLRELGKPIRIGFVGYVRFYDINKRLLDIFKNDSRFEMHFYGSHADVLRQYAEENGIANTAFHDSFPVKDTAKFLQRIDIINNVYGNNSMSLDYALSIKLYHGVYSRMPILVCPNTYMEQISKEYQLGFTVTDYTSEMKENLYEWYTHINFEKFNMSCSQFINKVLQDNQNFESAYQKYIKEI